MPLQNRVLPTGAIVAEPARGMFMGNRGRIHTPDRRLSGRRWTTTTWVTCAVCFRGRRRSVWGDGYTELFFLDEAVALAAGHRPCAECRREDYRRFQDAWRRAHGEAATAPAMNARLHADRIAPGTRRQRRHQAGLAGLPDGTFVLIGNAPALLHAGQLHPFTPQGYAAPVWCDTDSIVTVLTPRCTVAVLRAGYRPVIACGTG